MPQESLPPSQDLGNETKYMVLEHFAQYVTPDSVRIKFEGFLREPSSSTSLASNPSLSNMTFNVCLQKLESLWHNYMDLAGFDKASARAALRRPAADVVRVPPPAGGPPLTQPALQPALRGAPSGYRRGTRRIYASEHGVEFADDHQTLAAYATITPSGNIPLAAVREPGVPCKLCRQPNAKHSPAV